MENAYMRVGLWIKLHEGDDPASAKDQFCDHLRSGLLNSKDFAVTSLDVTGKIVFGAYFDNVLISALVHIRSSNNPVRAVEKVLDHISIHFMDDPSVSLQDMDLDVELLPRRREAIEATKTKRAKRNADASE